MPTDLSLMYSEPGHPTVPAAPHQLIPNTGYVRRRKKEIIQPKQARLQRLRGRHRHRTATARISSPSPPSSFLLLGLEMLARSERQLVRRVAASQGSLLGPRGTGGINQTFAKPRSS